MPLKLILNQKFDQNWMLIWVFNLHNHLFSACIWLLSVQIYEVNLDFRHILLTILIPYLNSEILLKYGRHGLFSRFHFQLNNKHFWWWFVVFIFYLIFKMADWESLWNVFASFIMRIIIKFIDFQSKWNLISDIKN